MGFGGSALHLSVLVHLCAEKPDELLIMSWGQSKREDQASPFGSYLGHPADSMVLKASVAYGEAVWNLWQAHIDELQRRPLGFWSKTLLSSADNYSLFVK